MSNLFEVQTLILKILSKKPKNSQEASMLIEKTLQIAIQFKQKSNDELNNKKTDKPDEKNPDKRY